MSLQAWLGSPWPRISPLLNAVDVDRYPCNTKAAPTRPTTVMLSHVYPLKDIMSAIKAAAIIVHEYKITGAPAPLSPCCSAHDRPRYPSQL